LRFIWETRDRRPSSACTRRPSRWISLAWVPSNLRFLQGLREPEAPSRLRPSGICAPDSRASAARTRSRRCSDRPRRPASAERSGRSGPLREPRRGRSALLASLRRAQLAARIRPRRKGRRRRRRHPKLSPPCGRRSSRTRGTPAWKAGDVSRALALYEEAAQLPHDRTAERKASPVRLRAVRDPRAWPLCRRCSRRTTTRPRSPAPARSRPGGPRDRFRVAASIYLSSPARDCRTRAR